MALDTLPNVTGLCGEQVDVCSVAISKLEPTQTAIYSAEDFCDALSSSGNGEADSCQAIRVVNFKAVILR